MSQICNFVTLVFIFCVCLCVCGHRYDMCPIECMQRSKTTCRSQLLFSHVDLGIKFRQAIGALLTCFFALNVRSLWMVLGKSGVLSISVESCEHSWVTIAIGLGSVLAFTV